jgi:hypothetical protein
MLLVVKSLLELHVEGERADVEATFDWMTQSLVGTAV